MPNLRPSVIQQVIDELAASKFGTVGFDVTFPDSGDLASIVFAVKKGAKFAISSSGTTNQPLLVRMSPGEYKSEDSVRCDDFKSCLSLIRPWTRRIHEDLCTQDPGLTEFQSFRQALDAHLKSNVKDEAQPF